MKFREPVFNWHNVDSMWRRDCLFTLIKNITAFMVVLKKFGLNSPQSFIFQSLEALLRYLHEIVEKHTDMEVRTGSTQSSIKGWINEIPTKKWSWKGFQFFVYNIVFPWIGNLLSSWILYFVIWQNTNCLKTFLKRIMFNHCVDQMAKIEDAKVMCVCTEKKITLKCKSVFLSLNLVKSWVWSWKFLRLNMCVNFLTVMFTTYRN